MEETTLRRIPYSKFLVLMINAPPLLGFAQYLVIDMADQQQIVARRGTVDSKKRQTRHSRHSHPIVERLRARIRPNALSLIFVVLVFTVTISPSFSQQDSRKKARTFLSAATNIREIEKREKEKRPKAERKKVENENLRLPYDLPIPPGAKREVFRVKSLQNSTTTQSQKRYTGRKLKAYASATVNLREIARQEKERGLKYELKKVENENLERPPILPVPRGAKGKTFRVKPQGVTGAAIPQIGAEPRVGPSFPAIGDDKTRFPPDVAGAVGPEHVMTVLNTRCSLQDKTGTELSTVSLNNFFGQLGGAPAVFDPRVQYDPFSDRWIITAAANSASATSALVIAVSTTGDPLGTWKMLLFDADETDINWLDFPNLGFNKNWIVVTGNLYTMERKFGGVQLFIFDKAALYGGPTSPTVITVPKLESGTISPAVTLDNSINTEFLVTNFLGNNDGNGLLRISTITGTPAAPIFTPTMLFPNVDQPWADVPDPTLANFAPQKNNAEKIQNNDSRIQNVVFQAGSLWCTHTVFLPIPTPTRSTAQWWQINPETAEVLQTGRVEDPSGTTFYAFPSISVNALGDVVLGYSSFSPTQFAGSNYSFRRHTDPPNTLRPSVPFKAGLASYFKPSPTKPTENRWGDYSSASMDPDNFSLWTVQQYAEQPADDVDRWGTEWQRVIPPVGVAYCRRIGRKNLETSFLSCTLSTPVGFDRIPVFSGKADWGYDTGVAWVDVNGDGRTDYCRRVGDKNLESSFVSCTLSTGAGFGETIRSNVIDWGYEPGRAWADFDGDGEADYCRRVGKGEFLKTSFLSCTVKIGTDAEHTIMSEALDWGYETGVAWVDFNGDGKADYCRRVGDKNLESSFVSCTLSNGDTFGQTIRSRSVVDWGYEPGRAWVDFDGDGGADYCRRVGKGEFLKTSFLSCTVKIGTDREHTIMSEALDWGYDTGVAWVDFNGDRKADYCRRVGDKNLESSFVSCTLSNENGDAFGRTIRSKNVVDWGYEPGRAWVDFDGDGGADYCRRVGKGVFLRSQFLSCTVKIGTDAEHTIMSETLDWGHNAGVEWTNFNGPRF